MSGETISAHLHVEWWGSIYSSRVQAAGGSGGRGWLPDLSSSSQRCYGSQV